MPVHAILVLHIIVVGHWLDRGSLEAPAGEQRQGASSVPADDTPAHGPRGPSGRCWQTEPHQQSPVVRV